jgi:hypothetical protein
MKITHKLDGDEVYIQRHQVGEDERVCIGLLHELRSDTGDLTEMRIEPFEGTLDNLVGDNLIYFENISSELYRFSRFEQYPDCDEIVVEPEDKPGSPWVTELGVVIKEAEETISLVRQGKSIQKVDPTRTSGPKIQNLTRSTRPSRLSLARRPK